MAVTKIIFNPGINKEFTDLMDKGGWSDGNLVRFRKGLPEKIGGWEKTITSSYNGTGRALTAWVALDATRYLGLGTTTKYYVQGGGALYDITPIRSTTSAGDVTFDSTSGSSSIQVTDTSHGAVQNDFVTFSGAASLGGNITAAVLNQEYQITAIENVNSYVITAKDTSGNAVLANSDDDAGNGGSSVVGTYQISVGLDVLLLL